MSLFSVTSATLATSLLTGTDHPASIDIPVGAGELLSLKDVVVRALQQALGGVDRDEAEKFLEQSGLMTDAERLVSRQNNPATGQSFYRFNAEPNFWQSVDHYRQQGQALSLATSSNHGPSQLQPTRSTQTTAYNTRTGIDRRRQLQQRYNPRLPVIRQTAPSASQPLMTEEQYARLRSGADGKTYKYAIATNNLKTISDPRPEMLRRAALQAGYDADAVAEYVKRNPELVYKSGPHYNEVVTLADAKNLVRQPTIEIGLDAGARRTLTRLEIELKGTPDAKLSLEIQDEIAKINARYEKLQSDRSAKGRDNRLLDAFEDLDRQNEIKTMIDRVIDSSGRDFRADSTDAQKLANQTTDTVASTMRTLIDAHPLYRLMPQAVKDQMVDFGVGVTRGTISLASVPAGLQQALSDGVQDIVLGGARKLGYDTTRIEQRLGAERQRSAEQWAALANLHTPRTMRGEVAYEIKREQNLRLTPYDAPNWAVKAGEISIKAVPYIAAGIATDGASFGVQIAATAALSGTMAGGENYASTRERGTSMRAATLAAVQGAVMPIGNRLGIGGDLALNAATTYTMAKVQGQQDDNLIFQDIFAQTAFAGAFRAGGKINEALSQKLGRSVTEAEARQTFRETVRQETQLSIRENLKAAYTEYQSRITAAAREATANYGKNNRVVTREQASVARQEIRTQLATQLNTGIDPLLLAQMTKVATFHVEAGARTFAEFSTKMLAELGESIRPQLENLYRQSSQLLGHKVDELEIANVKAKGKTDVELQADLEPTLRYGELPSQAQARIRATQGEIHTRDVVRVYDGLGEQPPRIDITENDASYAAQGAHTLKRHGSQIILRRMDAPAGTITIEGRLHGDAPWPNKQNYSYKWLNEITMARTVNDHFQNNWDRIRSDLALKGEYKLVFDAGKAVGEGYFNKNQGGTGPVHSIYSKTSYVSIHIHLDPGNPSSLYIVTAYPSGRGY